MGNMRYCPQCGHALEPTARFCENCGAAVSKVPDEQKNETEKVFTPRRSGEIARRVAGNPPQRRPLGDADTTQTGAGNPPQRRPLGDADTTQTGAGNRPQRRPSGGYYEGSAQTGAGNPQRRPQTGASAVSDAEVTQTGAAGRPQQRPQAGPSIPNIGRDNAFSPQRPTGASPEEWRRTRAQQYAPTNMGNRWDPEEDEDEEEGRFTTLQYILLGFIGVLLIALLTFGAFWLIGRSRNHSSNSTTAGQAQTEQSDAKGSEKKETEAIKILDGENKASVQAETAGSETEAQTEAAVQTEATATTLNYTDFTVTLPADWKGKYGITQQDNFYIFYQQSSKALGYNGTLFTIGKYTDMSYQDLPSYRVLGMGGGAAYVLMLPTDVQYAQNNEAAQKEYTAMASEINQIAAGIQILVTGDGPQTEAIQIQEQTQAQAQADSGEYILPESSERALTDTDVQGMSYDDLQMAINEIYARHGRIFGTESIQQYFEGKSWYQGTTDADHFSDSVFSSVENQNIQFLLKKMGLE